MLESLIGKIYYSLIFVIYFILKKVWLTGIKIWKSKTALINQLIKNRNLTDNDSILENFLTEANYFEAINGLESIFLKSSNRHQYFQKNYENKYDAKLFHILYDFDHELSEEILKIIIEMELKIKNSVAYNFCRQHCQSLNETMEYTNKMNYKRPEDNYPFSSSSSQNKYLLHDYDEDKFIFFKKSRGGRLNYLNSIVKKHDSIDKNFYCDNEYFPRAQVAQFSENKHVAVPLWVAIQFLTFGQLNMMLHLLKTEDLNKVIEQMNVRDKFTNTEFLNCMDVFNNLRNTCAHGRLVIRFRTKANVQLSLELIRKYNLYCYKHDSSNTKKYLIGLYDSLNLLSIFENLHRLKKIFKKFRYTFFKCKCGTKLKDKHRAWDSLMYRIGKYQNTKGNVDAHTYRDCKRIFDR